MNSLPSKSFTTKDLFPVGYKSKSKTSKSRGKSKTSFPHSIPTEFIIPISSENQESTFENYQSLCTDEMLTVVKQYVNCVINKPKIDNISQYNFDDYIRCKTILRSMNLEIDNEIDSLLTPTILILHGPVGIGKTHLLVSASKELSMNGKKVLYVDGPYFGDQYQKSGGIT